MKQYSMTKIMAYFNRNRSLLLFIILLIALLLRIYNINQPFVDIVSWRQSSVAMMAENFFKKDWNIFYPEVNWSGPGPSYQGREFQTVSYISALLYIIVGQQDWVGRMVSVIFGVWGVFALYQLIRRVWDEKHAIAGAAVMAVLPVSVFFERCFLPDPAMVSLVTTSLWMLVAYLQTNRKLFLVIAALTGCWGFLTKVTGMLIGLPMIYATFKIYNSRKQINIAKLTPLLITGIIVVIPVICYYLWARHLYLTYPPHHFAGSGAWVWDEGVRSWIQQKYFLEKLFFQFSKWLWGIPFICLIFLGLIFPPPSTKIYGLYTENKNHQDCVSWIFHIWLVGCFFFYLIGAREITDNPWNFHIFSPAAAALGGRALLLLTTNQNSRPAITIFRFLGIVGVIVISEYFTLRNMNTKYADSGYKMGMALNKIKKPGDLVVTMAQEIGDPVAIYYSRCRGWVFPPPANMGVPMELPKNDQESISALEDLKLKGADWFGIVNQHYQDIQLNHPSFASSLLSNYKLYEQTPDFVIFQLQTVQPSEEKLTLR